MNKIITCLLLAVLIVGKLQAQNDALTVLSNGNVGIGTTDPKNTLEVNGTVKAASLVGDGAAVRGMVVMWWGDINKVPPSWALCNGQNGTPDLRNRFIVGAGQSYSMGDSGGHAQVVLNVSQLPSHVHAGTTGAAGSHQHNIEGTDADGLSWRKRYIPGATTVEMGYGGGRNADPNKDHWRGLVNTDSQPDHMHSFTTAASGGNGAHENRPPYFALAYIMKL